TGSTLVEVLVAGAILATAGTSLLAILGQTSHSLRNVVNTERTVHSAAEQLDRLVLLDGAALVAREGDSREAGWSLRIAQIAPGLFDVAIAPSDTSAVLLT